MQFFETEPIDPNRKFAGYSYNYEKMTKRPVYYAEPLYCSCCGATHFNGYDFMVHRTTGQCTAGKYLDN
jgi:hypothetical protein